MSDRELLELELADGTLVYVETRDAGADSTLHPAPAGRIAGSLLKADSRFEEAVGRIRPAAQALLNSLRGLDTPEEIGLDSGSSLTPRRAPSSPRQTPRPPSRYPSDGRTGGRTLCANASPGYGRRGVDQRSVFTKMPYRLSVKWAWEPWATPTPPRPVSDGPAPRTRPSAAACWSRRGTSLPVPTWWPRHSAPRRPSPRPQPAASPSTCPCSSALSAPPATSSAGCRCARPKTGCRRTSPSSSWPTRSRPRPSPRCS